MRDFMLRVYRRAFFFIFILPNRSKNTMTMPFLKILRILTIILALLLTVVSVAGAFLPGTYARDSASMAAQGTGQDLVDLFLGVPLLLVSFFYAARGNRTATLVYAGILFYIMYSFIIYCFGVWFNRFFLLYCATLGVSLYSFILVMSGLGRADVSSWFRGAPVKGVSVYIFFVALVFYALWLKAIIPAIVTNSVPPEVSDYNLPVNPVHVIDLVFALPGLVIGSVLLWQGRGMGYIIASVSLVFMIFLTLALVAMVVMLVKRDISEDLTVAIVFAVLSVASTVVAFLLFRKVKPTTS